MFTECRGTKLDLRRRRLAPAKCSARHRRPAGATRLRVCSVLLSAESFHQSRTGQHLACRHGIRAVVPRDVVAEPAWNPSALPGARGACVAGFMGALRAPADSLETDR